MKEGEKESHAIIGEEKEEEEEEEKSEIAVKKDQGWKEGECLSSS